jgi:hypothetical protein
VAASSFAEELTSAEVAALTALTDESAATLSGTDSSAN